MNARRLVGSALVGSGLAIFLFAALPLAEKFPASQYLVSRDANQKFMAQYDDIGKETRSLQTKKITDVESVFLEDLGSIKKEVRRMRDERAYAVEEQRAGARFTSERMDSNAQRFLLGLLGCSLLLSGVIVLAQPKFPELEITG